MYTNIKIKLETLTLVLCRICFSKSTSAAISFLHLESENPMGPREKGSNQLDKSLLRRILRLQCSDGGSHDVSFEVARMSPRLNHIIRGTPRALSR